MNTEKCEYIELLENQKSELGHTLDQTKHKVEEYEHNERLLKSRIDDLISENMSFWNFLEELEHIERLLKSRIYYLTSENTKFQNMIDVEKSQNEKLANDLKDSQIELGEFCAKSDAQSALNTDLQTQLKCLRNEVSDFCDTRDQAFKNKETLKKHMIMKHTPIGKYACGICERTFRKSKTLRMKMKVVMKA